MTLRDDAKFTAKRFCALKTDIRNLVNFHAGSRKSENFHFDWILLSKACKDLDQKIQKSYVSQHWGVMQSLKKNLLLIPKRTWGIWWISSKHSQVQKFHFDGLILSKVYEVWAKKIQRSYLSWHWTVIQNLNKPWLCGLKNDMRNWVNVH